MIFLVESAGSMTFFLTVYFYFLFGFWFAFWWLFCTWICLFGEEFMEEEDIPVTEIMTYGYASYSMDLDEMELYFFLEQFYYYEDEYEPYEVNF